MQSEYVGRLCNEGGTFGSGTRSIFCSFINTPGTVISDLISD